jgi:hypothetical protein
MALTPRQRDAALLAEIDKVKTLNVDDPAVELPLIKEVAVLAGWDVRRLIKEILRLKRVRGW